MPAGSVLSCNPHQSKSSSPPPELPAATRPFAPELFSRDGLSFWFQGVGPNYFATHRHPQAQVALGYGVRDGEFSWQQDGATVERPAGGDLIWLLPGNTFHSLRLRRAAFWIVFYFDSTLDVFRDVTVRATLVSLSGYVRRDGLIGELGTALRRERTAGFSSSGHVMNLGSLLGSCLMRAHGQDTMKDGYRLLALPDDVKESVRGFVIKHMQEPLTLPILAREAGMGADYFSRRLRFTTGLSVEQFVLHERLNHAQILLRTGKHKVETVAELCGFQSHATLTKRFTLRFGRPPSSYLPGDCRI